MARLDITEIKDKIKEILEESNWKGAVTDLSYNMTIRVQKVLTINPARLPVQSSFFPYVSVFFDDKSITLDRINIKQTDVRRTAELAVKITGVVWNNNITDPTRDEADDDCEALMENIENILRAEATLEGKVKWQFPTAVTYHTLAIPEEDAHLRVGIMNVTVRTEY